MFLGQSNFRSRMYYDNIFCPIFSGDPLDFSGKISEERGSACLHINQLLNSIRYSKFQIPLKTTTL